MLPSDLLLGHFRKCVKAGQSSWGPALPSPGRYPRLQSAARKKNAQPSVGRTGSEFGNKDIISRASR